MSKVVEVSGCLSSRTKTTTLKASHYPFKTTTHSTRQLDRYEKHASVGLSVGCVHHWLLTPSDEVCRCEGEPHHHGTCKKCGAAGVWPVSVEWDSREAMRALAVMMGIHHRDEAPKGGAV